MMKGAGVLMMGGCLEGTLTKAPETAQWWRDAKLLAARIRQADQSEVMGAGTVV